MKKLLIVLGAGSSLEFGMPSVNEIDKWFEKWANDRFQLNSEKNKNLYTWVKETVSEYQINISKNGEAPETSFENTLYTIQAISSLSDNRSYDNNNALRAFLKLKDFPKIVRYFNNVKVPDGYDFKELQSTLTDNLLNEMRKKCKTLSEDKKNEIAKIKQFFEILKEDFEIGFINLNYDNVILTALPDLSTGFNRETGKFDRNEFYNSKWNFCYHIHGSVHFDMKTTGFGYNLHEIYWNNDLNSSFNQNSSGRNSNFTSEGNVLLNSNIITGLDKANQILKDPFRQYFTKIDSLIYESDAILFIGYGFSDLHLNKLFPFHRLEEAKKRKVVVIDWANENTESILYRDDNWTHKMFETLVFNGHEMGNGYESIPPMTIIDYKKNKTFEFSLNEEYPLSVWYNGFLEATNYAEKFKRALI